MSATRTTRREALQAASQTVRSAARSEDPGRPVKLPPVGELNNALEFDETAKAVLPAGVYRTIAGGEREVFDRITFRPRMNIAVLDMDLTVEVLGQSLFTPIVVAPISEQGRFHQEGELAMLRGAEAAQALVIISSRSTVPFDRIAGQAKAPFWYSVYLEPDARKQAHAAAAAGAKAIVVTAGGGSSSSNGGAPRGNGRIDWAMVDQIRKGLAVPLAIKAVMTADEARTALEHDVQGVVVSNHGGTHGASKVAPMDALASIVDTVGGKVPVLIDGGFRRGTCALKALALGARAVLIGRPVAWGLASYGSDGVQAVLELIQNELARSIGMLGVSRPAQLSRDHVKVHKRSTG